MKTKLFAFRIVLALLLRLVDGQPAHAEPARFTSEYLSILRSGDAQMLGVALGEGASTSARDALGNTPLMYAAIYGDLPCMELLLQHGAEVNVTNEAGATPLMRAAFDFAKVRLLLARGADVHARSALGNTALMLAARPADSHRAVELLLAKGADPNATNLWGASALMAAVAGGDSESVRLLLERGANPNAQPGADPVAFLLGGGRSALMWAAYRGDVTMLQQLLDAGADVNAIGFLGTALAQSAWSERADATRLLLERGAKVDQAGPFDGYAPLHWAASSEQPDSGLVSLLLSHGADPNQAGGENVDAFMGTAQTPVMLALRRGATPIVEALVRGGATNATPDRPAPVKTLARDMPERLDSLLVRSAISQAIPPLQKTSVQSKQSFVRHASRQDCTSCHQQYLPLAAIGLARKMAAPVDTVAEQELIRMVRQGDIKEIETDWQPLFHPDPAASKGYNLLGQAAEDLPADETTDSWVHHLSVIQGTDGRWHNNLPRPPMQTGDIGATALAVHALQRYPLPGRKAALAKQVDRARQWLWTVKPDDTESLAYQILGLAWAGEPAHKLKPLAEILLNKQRADGGWAQLAGLTTDAYATGQAVYALRVAGGLNRAHPAIEQGLRFLLGTQLADGTWFVRRRAFPFQPTMDSGFPHGRDSWISAAGSSWAVMALSLQDESTSIASTP